MQDVIVEKKDSSVHIFSQINRQVSKFHFNDIELYMSACLKIVRSSWLWISYKRDIF